MKNHTDKSLLGFLGFGIFLYLLSMGYGGDPSVDFIGNPSDTDPDTSIVLSLADTTAVLEEISPESYTLNAETASDTSIVLPLADTMAVLEKKYLSKAMH